MSLFRCFSVSLWPAASSLTGKSGLWELRGKSPWKLFFERKKYKSSRRIKQTGTLSHDLCERGGKEYRQMVKYGDKTCKNKILSKIVCMNSPIMPMFIRDLE